MIKALIIDDDPGTLQSCRSLLEWFAGIPALTAETGAEGLLLARESAVGVIIADLNLPDMNGLDILRRMRAAGILTPFIIVTGFGSVTTAIDALRLGATDYLQKPYFPDELLNAVCAALGGTLRVPDGAPTRAVNCGSREGVKQMAHVERVPADERDESDARLDEVLSTLTSSLSDPLDIRGLAQRVNLGESRLRQIFRKVMGTSVVRYRNDRRLAEAARLLTDTHKRVSEIAFEVGFQPSTLDRLFRRKFAKSPREYRAHVRKQGK